MVEITIELMLRSFPWALPACIIGAVAGAILAVIKRDWSRPEKFISVLTGAWLGLLLGVSVLPGPATPAPPSRYRFCSFSVTLHAPDFSLLDDGGRTLNVILYAMGGLVVGLIPHRRVRWVALAWVLVLPVLAETAQYWFTQLGRSCQADDVVDAWEGAVLGALVACIPRALITRAKQSRHPSLHN